MSIHINYALLSIPLAFFVAYLMGRLLSRFGKTRHDYEIDLALGIIGIIFLVIPLTIFSFFSIRNKMTFIISDLVRVEQPVVNKPNISEIYSEISK